MPRASLRDDALTCPCLSRSGRTNCDMANARLSVHGELLILSHLPHSILPHSPAHLPQQPLNQVPAPRPDPMPRLAQMALMPSRMPHSGVQAIDLARLRFLWLCEFLRSVLAALQDLACLRPESLPGGGGGIPVGLSCPIPVRGGPDREDV